MSHPHPAPASRQALVIGATGSFGSHVTAALLNRGWTIRALARNREAARTKTGVNMPIDWVRGDAMNADDVVGAARGVQLLVHAANPPAYRNWAGTVLPMLESSIAAAKANDARLMLPGTVYNFAPDAGASIGETTPHAPITRKGAIRARMEARLAEEEGAGLKSLVVRAGDFFGPATPNSALNFLVVPASGKARAVLRAGPANLPHGFAYMPDLAKTVAMILEREDNLAPREVFHFAGHWLTPRDLLAAVRAATGRAGLPLLPLPWAVVGAAALFDETMREMLEMRYLWRRPIGLDNAKLVAFLGEEPRTPLATAMRASLSDLAGLDAENSVDDPTKRIIAGRCGAPGFAAI